MLMAADVPLNLIKDEQGRNLLHLASRDGRLSLVQLLVQNIPINDEDNRGYTPLHYASAGNNFAIAATLFLHQADVNAYPDGTTNTPADQAQTQEMLDFIKCIGGATVQVIAGTPARAGRDSRQRRLEYVLVL